MKILKKENLAKRNQKLHTQAERKILQNMNNNFIVTLHFAFQTKDKLFMVLDFMQGGFCFKSKIIIFLNINLQNLNYK